MKNIGEFFSKVQNKHAQELFTRKIVTDAIFKATKVVVAPETIAFKGTVVMLNGLDQAEKSEIYIKKIHILADIEMNLKTRKVIDIR